MARERLSYKKAQTFTKRMHRAQETAQAVIKKAQEKKEANVNQYRYKVDFYIGDKVWVLIKNWKTQRPSRKLDY